MAVYAITDDPEMVKTQSAPKGPGIECLVGDFLRVAPWLWDVTCHKSGHYVPLVKACSSDIGHC